MMELANQGEAAKQPVDVINSTLETQKTAAAIRLSLKSQNTED